MPRLDPNFAIGMGVMIIILLDSIRPKHFNTRILQVSLVLSFTRFETTNATQKFINFVVESQLCLHLLGGCIMTLVDGWLVGCLNEVCILCCISMYLLQKDPLIPNVTILNSFSLLLVSHNLLRSEIRLKRGKKRFNKRSSKQAREWTGYLNKMALQARQSTFVVLSSFIIIIILDAYSKTLNLTYFFLQARTRLCLFKKL